MTEYSKYVSYSLQDALRHLGRTEPPEQKKEVAPYKKEERPSFGAALHYDKASDEQIDKYVDTFLTDSGIEKNDDNKRTIKEKIERIRKGWSRTNEAEILYIESKMREWPKAIKNTLSILDEEFGVDINNHHNLALVLDNIQEIIDERGLTTRQKIERHTDARGHVYKTSSGYSDLLTKLLKLDWKYKGNESFDTLMNRLTFTPDLQRFSGLDFKYLERWLKKQYKENPKEFEKFTDRFIPEFEEMTRTKTSPETGTLSPLKTLTDKQKEYIEELISKVSVTGYEKLMKKEKQPAMNL